MLGALWLVGVYGLFCLWIAVRRKHGGVIPALARVFGRRAGVVVLLGLVGVEANATGYTDDCVDCRHAAGASDTWVKLGDSHWFFEYAFDPASYQPPVCSRLQMRTLTGRKLLGQTNTFSGTMPVEVFFYIPGTYNNLSTANCGWFFEFIKVQKFQNHVLVDQAATIHATGSTSASGSLTQRSFDMADALAGSSPSPGRYKGRIVGWQAPTLYYYQEFGDFTIPEKADGTNYTSAEFLSVVGARSHSAGLDCGYGDTRVGCSEAGGGTGTGGSGITSQELQDQNVNQDSWWIALLRSAFVPGEESVNTIKSRFTNFVNWGPMQLVVEVASWKDIPAGQSLDLTMPAMNNDGTWSESGPNSAAIDLSPVVAHPRFSFVRTMLSAFVWIGLVGFIVRKMVPVSAV